MTALNDRFWAKVLFKEFIRHFRKLTDEQKVEDINASMDALEDLDDSGNSFGALMVKWSMERVEQYPQARDNGKKGGRPRKGLPQPCPIGTDETRTGGDMLPSYSSSPSVRNARRRVRPPKSFDEVAAFADEIGLDYDDTRLWWERNFVERPGCDKDGVVFENWKGALVNACKAEAEKRKAG